MILNISLVFSFEILSRGVVVRYYTKLISLSGFEEFNNNERTFLALTMTGRNLKIGSFTSNILKRRNYDTIFL